ncbi:SDR family NAD(P)-dependent oxidoreductase [Streptomyces globosus]|uniref:SDR family NAD(P)-dependent oxidoreductase n=1 Tax=Streptomyces globosus TaxID=68209 RepID=UPI00380B0C73
MTVAIVTGASRGLGRALAAELAARGWRVVVSGRDTAALTAPADVPGAVALAGDVRHAPHRAALVAAAQRLGGLDLLVNNAAVLGAEPLVPLAEQSPDGFRHALEVNLVAPLALVQEALPLLRASPRGAVLNLSSAAAVAPYATWGAYGATKAGLDLLSGVLAVEEPELRVWWADPGTMATRMMASAEPDADLGTLPTPHEVAPLLLRLVEERPPSGRYTARDLARGAVVR